MTSETKKEETKLTYDDRRKELTQVKSQITINTTDEKEVDGQVEEAKAVSTVNHSMKVVYSEEGIKLAHKGINEEIKFLEQREIKLKEDMKFDEMPDELKDLKEKIDLLTEYAKSDKVKTDYESVTDRLKFLKKELSQLTNEIGTRLKFD